jgi:hypothetical protein
MNRGKLRANCSARSAAPPGSTRSTRRKRIDNSAPLSRQIASIAVEPHDVRLARPARAGLGFEQANPAGAPQGNVGLVAKARGAAPPPRTSTKESRA